MDLESLRARAVGRDDLESWRVLGDALVAAGDPRGELMALQAGLEEHPGDAALREAERRLRFEHRHALLGPLVDQALPYFVAWRWGHVAELDLAVSATSPNTPTEAVGELLAGLDLFALRRLRLVGAARYEGVMDAFAARSWPVLERLELGPVNPGAGRLDRALGPILSAASELRYLRLEGPEQLGGLEHARLEGLMLAIRPEQVDELDLSGLPALRTLTLRTRRPPDPGALERVLRGRVERLVVYGAPPVLPGIQVESAMAADPATDRLLTPAEQSVPRRFHRRGRFRAVRRSDALLFVREGKVGRPGLERHERFATPYDAARALHARAWDWRQEGFAEVWVPA
ncbi:MAG: hypothetical protein R3F61_02525 [Myxococcota bacterium]